MIWFVIFLALALIQIPFFPNPVNIFVCGWCAAFAVNYLIQAAIE